MDILFFANLGDDNASALNETLGAREAVLLSTPRASRKSLDVARRIKERGLPLAADNGNVAVISQLLGDFGSKAADLREERQRESPEPTSRPSAQLRSRFRALSYEVQRRCADLSTPERQGHILATQTAVSPDFFMCLEDLTVPLHVQLDIERIYTGRRRSGFVSAQDFGLQAAEGVSKGAFGTAVGMPYATVHAFDYDSAYQVGLRAARVDGLMGIAVGLASFLNDRNYTNYYVVEGRRRYVKGRKYVPQRYLRMLLVSLGFIDGFTSQRGGPPRFHGLGAGAPIVLPLLSLCAYGSPLLSVDSTAPEKNASMGKLFANVPAPLTLSVPSIAQALVEGRRIWDCPCPFCLALQREIPFDLEAARRYYEQYLAPQKIEEYHLTQDDGIGRFLSICWETRRQPARSLVYGARVEHSQWVLAEIARGLRERSSSYGELRSWVTSLCEAYRVSAQSAYALQIEECLRLVDRLRGIGQ